MEWLPEFLNLKIQTLIAGLGGAMITLLRKSDGRLQSRLIGYFTAALSVIYLVPVFIWLIEWKFGIDMHPSGENLIAFVIGLLAQTITESFIDNPMGAIASWSRNAAKIKQIALEHSSDPGISRNTGNTEGENDGADPK